jgi:hypothetical protein
MTSTRILLVIAILQGLTLVTLWKGDAITTPARAALPDPGADRKDMIAELKGMNDKLGAIQKVLESGKLQVEVVAADNKK